MTGFFDRLLLGRLDAFDKLFVAQMIPFTVVWLCVLAVLLILIFYPRKKERP